VQDAVHSRQLGVVYRTDRERVKEKRDARPLPAFVTTSSFVPCHQIACLCLLCLCLLLAAMADGSPAIVGDGSWSHGC